jgi:hypothetical protein
VDIGLLLWCGLGLLGDGAMDLRLL